MRILLTNDDGINSDGLWAAARGLARVGHLTVIGTDDDWSGGSASIRMTIGARLARFHGTPDDIGPDVEAYSIDAAPGGAVLAGVMTGLFEPFDLVVSGANWGVNVGGDMLYSGTLGAAATGFQRGVTSFGISAERGVYRGEPQRWDGLSDVCERVARWQIARTGAPILLNVNVPNRSFADMRGAVLARPVTWANLDRARLRVSPESEDSWRVTATVDHEVVLPNEPGTDAGAVRAGQVAITHVRPTGWQYVPPPADIGELLEALAPGSPVPSYHLDGRAEETRR